MQLISAMLATRCMDASDLVTPTRLPPSSTPIKIMPPFVFAKAAMVLAISVAFAGSWDLNSLRRPSPWLTIARRSASVSNDSGSRLSLRSPLHNFNAPARNRDLVALPNTLRSGKRLHHAVLQRSEDVDRRNITSQAVCYWVRKASPICELSSVNRVRTYDTTALPGGRDKNQRSPLGAHVHRG